MAAIKVACSYLDPFLGPVFLHRDSSIKCIYLNTKSYRMIYGCTMADLADCGHGSISKSAEMALLLCAQVQSTYARCTCAAYNVQKLPSVCGMTSTCCGMELDGSWLRRACSCRQGIVLPACLIHRDSSKPPKVLRCLIAHTYVKTCG